MSAKWIATGISAAMFLGFGLTINHYMSEASERDAVRNRAYDAAVSFCQNMEGTGLIAECDPFGGGRSVEVYVATETENGAAICRGAASRFAALKGGASGFSGSNWTLEVFTPVSVQDPVAVCPLV